MTARAAFRRALLPAVAGLALAALPAWAQEIDHDREQTAWNAVGTLLGDMLPLDHHAEFMVLAWHAAAANLCTGLVLDHERFGIAYAGLEHGDFTSLSDEEHEFFRHHLAVNFGVAVGVMLAEHSGPGSDLGAFCADARAFAEDPEHASYFDAEALEPRS